MVRVAAMRTLENALRRVGFCHVGGVDEVGRGCLAGSVVAAAVVLHPDRHIPGVCDSKLVPASERERLFDRILMHSNRRSRSEEHTSELQSRVELVCRLLLEKKKISHDCDSRSKWFVRGSRAPR